MRRPPPAAAEAAAPPPPLGPAEFAALMAALGPFETAPRIAVAVSGGPDSTALALLASAWARARGGAVLGLVVDHGLRDGSAAEAATAAGRLGSLGIASRVSAWAGDKPAAGIQASARAARLALLADACRGEGILHLLLAHQREDQAETVALRRAAGSGAVGLAGVPAVREVRGLRLLRPLLAVPRARLVATLAAAGQAWLADPSNAERRFARARLRQDPAFAADAAWGESLGHAVARTADDRRIAGLLALVARPDPLGFVRLDAAACAGLESRWRAALMRRVLTTVGGRAYPVATTVRPGDDGPAATAGGCIIVRRRDDLLVCREPGRIVHGLALAPGTSGLWDGRFAVDFREGTAPVAIRALGAEGAALLPRTVRRRARSAGVPAVVLHGLPSAWAGPELVACPPLYPQGLPPAAGFSITARLQPAWPLAAAAFAGVNVVSNPQPPIYRRATECEPTVNPASAAAQDEVSGPTSRRTQ